MLNEKNQVSRPENHSRQVLHLPMAEQPRSASTPELEFWDKADSARAESGKRFLAADHQPKGALMEIQGLSTSTINGGMAASQGKGSLSKAPEDFRGDNDSLYLIYTAEELRWILREMGVTGKNHEPPPPSPYSQGNGVVFTIAQNKDRATHSDVYLLGIMWALGRYGKNEGEYDQEACVTQSFRGRGSYEAVYATYRWLPEGHHTYALGLGYEIDFGELRLNTFNYSHRFRNGVMQVGKIPTENHLLFSNGEPFIAVFDYDTAKHGDELYVSLDVRPNSSWTFSNAWFHHIQLVQID